MDCMLRLAGSATSVTSVVEAFGDRVCMHNTVDEGMHRCNVMVSETDEWATLVEDMFVFWQTYAALGDAVPDGITEAELDVGLYLEHDKGCVSLRMDSRELLRLSELDTPLRISVYPCGEEAAV